MKSKKATRVKQEKTLVKGEQSKHLIKARGNYKIVTDWMRKKQVYTKQELIDFYIEELGKDLKAAKASAIIMLSPRLESKHGDCRGSASNPWGHLAYNDKLPRKFDPETGKKEKQRYRFRFRDVPMEKKHHTYYRRKIKQEKEAMIEQTPVTETGRGNHEATRIHI
jgi:hypothetical protein